MTYAKPINNEIVEYNRTLPFSTETTSFGVGTTAETLKEFGYLPVVGNEPEYDRTLQKISNVSYKIGENEITKFYEIVDLTNEEISARDTPQSITPRQARLVLLQDGLLDELEVLIANDKVLQIWWEYSLEIKRNDAKLIQAAQLLGITDAQLDGMFIRAVDL